MNLKKNQIYSPLLSAAIITFNEERIIEKTLSAINNWVDEIVVVDSYSTDNTLNILEMFNVTIYKQKWQGYAQQKNFAISKCSGKWILSLDADEIISKELKDEILKVITKPTKIKGFRIPRKLFVGKRWIKYGGYYPDTQLRLFKNHLNIYFKAREIHESLDLDNDVADLVYPLEHYAYKDLRDYKENLEKYALLATKEIRNKMFYVPMLRALWAFIYRYIFRLGFLEGELGFKLTKAYSEYVYKKYELAKIED